MEKNISGTISPIKEVGLHTAFKFLAFSILEIPYSFLIFPQLRKAFLQIIGATIGTNTILMKVKFFNWHHSGIKGLKIGKQSFIGDDTLLDLYSKITLEDQVTIAQRVTVLTHLNVGYSDHPLQKIFPKKSAPVIFKNGAVIGATSTILPGVTVGTNAFVAAGSVVVKNVPANTLVAGVPAKIIRKIK